MIMRRAESDPATAISQLTRDMARIRTDLDNIRTALSSRGRRVWRDTREQVGTTTGRAMQESGTYVREHPGVTAGITLGIVALVVGVFVGINRMRG